MFICKREAPVEETTREEELDALKQNVWAGKTREVQDIEYLGDGNTLVERKSKEVTEEDLKQEAGDELGEQNVVKEVCKWWGINK